MKKYIAIWSLAVVLLASSCTTQVYMDPAALSAAVSGKEFTFMARRAIPTNADVVNVMNSLPGGSPRMLDLSYGYAITLKPAELTVDLPYFGRMYIPNYDTSKNGYHFTSKDFSVTESTNKKNSKIITVSTRDVPNLRTVVIEVYKNGGASAYIDSNDRQPISYDGYLTKNPDR